MCPEQCTDQEMSRPSIFTSHEPEGQFKRVPVIYGNVSVTGQMGEKEGFGTVPIFS